MDDDGGLDIRPPGQQRPPTMTGARFKCTPCAQTFSNEFDLQAHLITKSHIKKSAIDASEMDDRDMYVDDTTVAYRAIMKTQTKFSGVEYVVLDKTDNETKCVLCKAILRDPNSIVDHMKTQKHVFAYIEKHYPEIFRSIQRRAKNQSEMHGKIREQAEILIKKYGKKEPLVHEKGYYNLLPEVQKQAVDRHLEAKRRELEDQRKCRIGESTPVDGNNVAGERRDTDIRMVGGHKNQNKEMINNKKKKSRKRRSPSSRRSRSPPPSLFGRRDRDKGRDKKERDSDRGSPRRARGTAPITEDKPVDYDALDKLDALPTEFDVYDTLCSCEWVPFDDKSAALIQPQLDVLEQPVIGVEYVAEYTDPRNQYQPGYLCSLCEARMNAVQAVRHFTSDVHVLNYMRKHCERQYMALQITTLSEDTRQHMKRKYVQDIANKENRRRIPTYIRLNKDQRQVFRGLREQRNSGPQSISHHRRVADVTSSSKDKDTRESKGKDSPSRSRDRRSERRAASSSRQDDKKKRSRSRSRSRDRSERRDDKNKTRPREGPVIMSLDARKHEREKALIMNQLSKEMPPFCEVEYEENTNFPLWYSNRRLSTDYYRRLAEPDALFYSVRDPDWHKSELYGVYGDWNPQIMRWLQDKFNFKMTHLRWLLKLLIDWRVPLYVPLQQPDLKPLEEEVESAVLRELLDQVLKPVNVLRNVQVIDHSQQTPQHSNGHRPPSRSDHRRRHRTPSPTRSNADEKKGISISINVSDSKKSRMSTDSRRHKDDDRDSKSKDKSSSSHRDASKSSRSKETSSRRHDRDDDKKASSSKSSKPKEMAIKIEPANEKERAMLAVIDQLLGSMITNLGNVKNDVLSLIIGFPNSRELLFRLATQRPTELQRLIELAKRPVLKAPEAMIEQLRKMLERETQAAQKELEDRRKAEKAEEDEKKQKEEQLKQRIDQARLDLLKNKREQINKEQENAEAQVDAAAAQNMQIFTPKVPNAQTSFGTQSTASLSAPLPASTFANQHQQQQQQMPMMGMYPGPGGFGQPHMGAFGPGPFGQMGGPMHPGMFMPNMSMPGPFFPHQQHF